ncbi:MAG: ATP-binding domain-containing protein, partial [Clostridia bacterium]|nr:ATP-binding domain-containing protein [Clostridia bacterium]
LSDYLQSVMLISDMDSPESGENVIVATVHAVKGLEFKVVFLVGLEEDIFPISRARGHDEQMEEERRLMYVGITRAKQKLFVSGCKTRYLYGRRNHMIESRFVENAGLAKRANFAPFDGAFDGGFKSTTKTIATQVDLIKTGNTSKGEAPLAFKVGQTVMHKRFGEGKILAIDLDERTGDIDFPQIGVKTLMLDIAPITIVE